MDTAVVSAPTPLDCVAMDSTQEQPVISTAARALMRDVIAARQSHELHAAGAPHTDGHGTSPTPSSQPAAETALALATRAVATIPSHDDGEPMEVVSAARLLAEARASYARAEAQLDLGLTLCEDWLTLRDRFYDAGALFAIAGYPTESARCLLHAAFINRAFGDDEEAVSALSVSADALKVEQPAMAVTILERLVGCYEKAHLPIQAAKCLRDAATLTDERLDDRARAIELYTRTIDAYDTSMPTQGKLVGMQRSLRDPCFERLCFLHIEAGHYEEAEKMFMAKARQRPTFAPTTRFYMGALLCILARGGADEDAFFDTLYMAKKRFEALQFEDRGLQKGKEQAFLKAVIDACEKNALNQLDLAWMTYKSYKTTTPSAAMDIIVAQVRQNLFDHLERYAV